MKEIAFFVNPGMDYHVASVLKILSVEMPGRCTVIRRRHATEYDFKNCAVAVVADPIGPHIVTAMQRAREAGVPSLGLEDGIVEYEHCWKKRPERYRPLLTDQLAVFGPYTKRILMSWGLAENRIVVTGCPRFDLYHELRQQPGPAEPRILLTSANTPYCDDQSKTEFRSAFLDVAKELESSGVDYLVRINRRKVMELYGRDEPALTGKMRLHPQSLAHRLGRWPAAAVSAVLRKLDPDRFSIARDIADSTAVITTISTVGLEAMAMGRPVAILNYSGETLYHRTPWEISGPAHLKRVVGELLNPPAAKMLFQEQLLSEYITFDGSASRRLVDHIVGLMKD